MVFFRAGDMIYLRTDEVNETDDIMAATQEVGTNENGLEFLRSLYEYVKEEYFDEVNRKSRHDQKAFNLAALFVTILSIVLGAPFLAEIDASSIPARVIIFYFATLVFFVLGLLAVSVSFAMVKMEGRPTPGGVIDHFRTQDNGSDQVALIRFLLIRTRDAHERFRKANLKRVKRMNFAYVCLLAGMISLVVTVVLTINLIPKG